MDLGHNLAEFLEVDDSITILVGVLDHLVDLSSSQVLADWSSNLLELLGSESSAAGSVEGLEQGLESSFVGVVRAETEDVEESSEVEVSSDAGSVDDVEDLGSLAFKVEGLDSVDELVSGDLSTAVIVEDIEDFLELADGVSIKSFSHVFVGVETCFSLWHKIFLI